MAERGSLFDADELDLEGFEPKKKVTQRPPRAQVPHKRPPQKKNPASQQPEPSQSELEKLASKVGFTPRNVRRSRRRRTGRTEQLNIKVTAEVHKEFYRIADEQGWVLGEVLEHALPALAEELQRRKR